MHSARDVPVFTCRKRSQGGEVASQGCKNHWTRRKLQSGFKCWVDTFFKSVSWYILGRRHFWSCKLSTTHCSLLDIYISQKNKVVCSKFGRPISNMSRGQTNQHFDLKIQIYYSHFSSIFCRNCQIQCFLDTVNAISKRLSHIFVSNCNLSTSTLWNSSNSVQKALDFTTPAKNRRKMSIIDLNFQIKKLISLATRHVWNWSSKFTAHSFVFCEM